MCAPCRLHVNQTLKVYRAEIVRWVSESMRPFSIVEDRGFQCLMKTGRPDYYLPSASTVSRDVKLVFARTRERIAKLLQVCFSLHTGLNLALAFAAVVRDLGLDRKMLSVTCDNTSNNDTMATELGALITAFSPVNHTCCFAHIINLISKSLLKQFDVKPKADDFDDDDNASLFELINDIETEELVAAQENDNDELADDDNVNGWVDEIEELTRDERANLEDYIQPAKRTLVKVRDCNMLHTLC